jgi:hypothetical protein
MPGGIGAVAYNAVIAQRPAENNTIVAFSGGSLLNLAQGKFGRYNENDVRWLAAIGADFGAIIVSDSSPFKTLKDVLAAVKADPSKVVFGAGGTVFRRRLGGRSAAEGGLQDPRAGRDGRQTADRRPGQHSDGQGTGCRHRMANHSRLLHGPEGQRRRLQGLE